MSLRETPSFTSQVRIDWDVQIPMRDGALLNASVYLPSNLSQPVHCCVAITPYTSDTQHPVWMALAKSGVPFVAVDCRGRGNSEGEFRPYIQEAQDGYDVVEWLAVQPFCNGKVAMCGGSYLGYVQWATAKEFPPHLATIVPTASPCMGVDFPMRNNILYPFTAQWIRLTHGKASQPKLFLDTQFWSQAYREWHESGRAFKAVGMLAAEGRGLFEEWVDHPHLGDYWDAYNPTAGEYARLQIPILTITGCYDDDQPGALEHYRQHLRHSEPKARSLHYLVIGPWDHAGTRSPAAEFGGIRVGAAGLLNVDQLHVDWFAWTLAGASRPDFLKDVVCY